MPYIDGTYYSFGKELALSPSQSFYDRAVMKSARSTDTKWMRRVRRDSGKKAAWDTRMIQMTARARRKIGVVTSEKTGDIALRDEGDIMPFLALLAPKNKALQGLIDADRHRDKRLAGEDIPLTENEMVFLNKMCGDPKLGCFGVCGRLGLIYKEY